MPSKKFIKDISEQIERLNDTPLSDEQRYELELWNRGRALQQIHGGFGWDVIEEIHQEIMQYEIEKLMNTHPEQVDAVRAQHAIAFAKVDFVREFKAKVQEALNQGLPETMKQQIRTPAPPESM